MGLRTSLTALAAVAFMASPAGAADLGLGTSGVADLEERVAELEATAAHKGNRKVSLTISGQINEDFSYLTLTGFNDHKISNNGNDASVLDIHGTAQVAPHVTAGFMLEINLSELGLLGSKTGPEPKLRQSFVSLKDDRVGEVSIGTQAQVTNDFDKHTTNNAWLAGKAVSLGVFSDAELTGIDVPFDGGYRNLVKYVSPTIEGFTLSADWGPSSGKTFNSSGGDTFDVAIRYDSKKTIKDFRVEGAVGYRRSTDLEVNILNVLTLAIPTGNVDTVLASGSAIHYPTGIFINAEFANQDWNDAHFSLRGYDVTAGVQKNWFPIGPTEVFGTWGRISVDPSFGSGADIDYFGAGATQDLNGFMQLYAGYRRYDTGTALVGDVDTFNAGAVIKF